MLRRYMPARFMFPTLCAPAILFLSSASASAGSGEFDIAVGDWEMKTEFQGGQISATMSLTIENGKLVGVWKSQGEDMKLTDLELKSNRLSFTRTVPGGPQLKFAGAIDGNKISGKYTGGFGELKSAGTRRAEARPRLDPKKYRGLLGPGNKKIKLVDGKTLVWAGGDIDGPDAQWYDFTGAPIPPEELQFGIGKDRIRSIDDPLFVAPDDPRLLAIEGSPYRRDERPKTNDEIMVIGYADGDDERAYPAALLDHHELVNDRIGGKPVTVGW